QLLIFLRAASLRPAVRPGPAIPKSHLSLSPSNVINCHLRHLFTSCAVIFPLCIAQAARAQSQDDLHFDVAPSRLSITETPFVVTRGTSRQAGFIGKARVSYWDRPLSVIVAGPNAEGTQNHIIAGTFAAEFAFSKVWSNGLD